MKEISVEEKAAHWDALMSCERVRLLGHAQLGNPEAQHIGFELWAKYPIDNFPNGRSNHEFSKRRLLEFIRAMIPKKEKFQLPTDPAWYEKLEKLEGDHEVSAGSEFPVERCPDCGRPIAKNAEECGKGYCPKHWAIRDKEAEMDCLAYKRATSPAGKVILEHVGTCMKLELPKSLQEMNEMLWQAFNRGRKFEKEGGEA